MAANPLSVRECRYRVASVTLVAAVALAALLGARLALAQELPSWQATSRAQPGADTPELPSVRAGQCLAEHPRHS